MIKAISFFLISLSLVLILISCSNNITTAKPDSTTSNSEFKRDAAKGSEQTAGYDKVEEVDKYKKVKKPVIYDIQGTSNKLGKVEKNSMLNWRKQISQFAALNSNLIYLNGQTDEKVVCLTFDDGPDNVITPKILDILKKSNIKGSFFFIGNRLEKFKSIVYRTYTEGNLVLNHSWSHPELIRKSDEVIKKEITSTESKIYEIIGRKPAIIRPPYGSVNKRVFDALENGGYLFVIWSIDTMDWSQREKENIAKNVLENIRPGDIVLMHSNEDKKATAEALPLIIAGLQGKGYKFVDLGEMLKINPYRD